ncbi:hypothetical protein Q8A67_015400 [Cirrhinus molitorella]|uniref:Uncharacterized protein n=1 Tax=Cirrhinus molitorella TaxID=172907 RepID=A0AA88PHN8_9TELE|nr:hypothetical protein Q8A67_015400 [Cirrhinus molitorella]
MAVTEEMQTVRTRASLFTLHHHPHHHRSPLPGAAVNIRLSPFLQLSPISLSARVCVLCPAPCFTSGTVCSDISWRGKASLHFRIDSLSRTRPLRAALPFAISLATRCLSNRREAVMDS